MSELSKPECTHPSGHHLHICELKKAGSREEIAARTDAPGYLCHNCNASANQGEDLCNPSPFIKR